MFGAPGPTSDPPAPHKAFWQAAYAALAWRPRGPVV